MNPYGVFRDIAILNITIIYKGRYHIRQALDLEILSSVLQNRGHTVRFVYVPDLFGVTDNVLQIKYLNALVTSLGKSITNIVETTPSVVIFSVLPGTYRWMRELAEETKKVVNAPIVFTGLHPTLVPDRVMKDRFVDYVIEGECEEAIPALINALKNSGDMEKVGNLRYRMDGEVKKTTQMNPVDLDSLPIPDKALFTPHVQHSYSYVAMVSRGCPFHCSYCEETSMKKVYGSRYFRRRKVDNIIEELSSAKQKYGFKEVIFKDSYLTGDMKWLVSLMKRYKEEIDLPFKCFCTINGFNEKTASLLKEAGCYCIEFGLQTWNERLRREVLKRYETNKEALEAFEICDKAGLSYDIDHMFDLPGEMEEDHIKGAKRYKTLRCLNRIKVHRLVYLPGAGIIEEGIKCASLPGNFDVISAEGVESDFYEQHKDISKDGASVRDFSVLYKILPLLPERMLTILLRRRLYKVLHLIPSAVTIIAQGIIAFKNRDLRFSIYLRYYPYKIVKAVFERGFRS